VKRFTHVAFRASDLELARSIRWYEEDALALEKFSTHSSKVNDQNCCF
jgi:hypothetical protein